MYTKRLRSDCVQSVVAPVHLRGRPDEAVQSWAYAADALGWSAERTQGGRLFEALLDLGVLGPCRVARAGRAGLDKG